MTSAAAAPRGTRRVPSRVRVTTPAVVTATCRRHRAAHHSPPHTATINGNLMLNATGRCGPVTSTAIAAESATRDQAMHDRRLRPGVRQVSSAAAGATGGASGALAGRQAATESRVSTQVPFQAGP
jgi:hypothetical protein